MAAKSFVIKGHARPKGSWNAIHVKGKIRFVPTSTPAAQWFKYIGEEVKRLWKLKKLWEGPILVDLVFLLPRPKSNLNEWPTTRGTGDIDKLTRAILDAMTGVVYVDDVQVVQTTELKVWQQDGEQPEVRVKVKQLSK